jgi:curved DNA-binding protein CbpA
MVFVRHVGDDHRHWIRERVEEREGHPRRMADQREIEGLGAMDAYVRLAPDVDLVSSKINATEGFVLSRVDGSLDLESLCLVTGLGENTTLDILRRLRSLGLILVGDEQPPKKEDARRASANSRKAAPPAVCRVSTAETSDAAVQPPEVTAPANASALEESEPDIELKPEMSRIIRELHGKLGELNFFQLIDADMEADTATLRRAYFQRSKLFHPDRYFNRNIGRYKEMLQEIFKQISAAFRFLEDEKQRQAYRQMVLQELEQESLVRAIEEQGAQAFREEAKEHPLTPSGSAEPREKKPSSAEHVETKGKRTTGSGIRVTPFKGGTEKDRPDTASYTRVPPFRGATEKNRPSTGNATRVPPARGGEEKSRPSTANTASVPPAREGAEKVRPPTARGAPVPQKAEGRTDSHREQPAISRRRTGTAPFLGRTMRARAFFEQGKRQLAEGQTQAAAASLKLAMSFNPQEPEYGRFYNEAVEKARVVVAENHYKRALVEESVGRDEIAKKFFLKAADLAPVGVYQQKAAEAMLAERNLIKAQEYAIRAVQFSPNSAEIRVTLAKVYEAAGMKKNARRELQQALTFDPQHAHAKELLQRMTGD